MLQVLSLKLRMSVLCRSELKHDDLRTSLTNFLRIWTGANPTITSYNARVVKIYNTMCSQSTFKNKKKFCEWPSAFWKHFFCFKKRSSLLPTCNTGPCVVLANVLVVPVLPWRAAWSASAHMEQKIVGSIPAGVLGFHTYIAMLQFVTWFTVLLGI
jgi:hypothetical protein